MSDTDESRPARDDPSPLVAALREYQAALDAGVRPDRAEFLARHPEVAAELAEALDGLEFLHGAAPGLRPAGGPRPAPPAVPPDGTLGDFRLVREVGRGGMGVVYEAVQISLARRVALKVLPFAATLDARQLRRFENEARAAAQLHHTHVVPVYAVGCERGVHYYAMQFIDGRPLSEVIAHLRQAPRPAAAGAETATGAASVTRPPTDSPAFFRTVASLGVQAADALEYAHQMGVVHRDVKPGNLILDGRDHLWVTDFGLARFQAAPGGTATGDLVGTLRYMSPEQAAGDPAIDPRSDVYSLGATLYELLTLRPAVPGSDPRTCLRQVLEEDPAPPRAWNRAVPAELETIVLKAMAKAPADRYGTARELADDLRRFLDDRPVLARRPTLLDRGRKWARRHPTALAAAVLLLVFVAAGLAAFAALADEERDKTKAALVRERQRAREAEQRFQLARRAADDMIRLAEAEMADAPHLLALRKQVLESALAYYQEFIELRRGDPEALAELAATRDRVKEIVADLAVMQGAWRHLLLKEPAVQDDLKLSDGQRAEVAALLAGIGERRPEPPGDGRPPTAKERSAQMLAEVKAHEKAIADLLTPGQLRRLDQIALQCRGPTAILDSDVAAKLKLTAEQRDRIRAIGWEALRPPPGFGPDLRAATDQIVALLSPEQKARLKELTGEPYTGPRRPMPFFGPPGPPPPFAPDRPPPEDPR